MAPLITVLIPAFNAATTLDRALKSALVQDYAPMEILVVDDGSTDGTRALAEGYASRGVTVLALERNRGECGAMNAGIEAATGDFIAFLDADDEWLPGKIAPQAAMLAGDASLSFVVCDARYWVGDVAKVTTTFEKVTPVGGAEAWRALLRRSYVSKPCVMARRDAIVRAGPFDPNLKVAGDQDMWIRLAMVGGVGIINQCLVHVHSTPGSLMKRNPFGVVDFMLPMIERHVAAQRHRLGDDEARTILATRHFEAGRFIYARGHLRRGMAQLARAVRHGTGIGTAVNFALRASPPAQWVKRHLKRSPTPTGAGGRQGR